MKKIIAILVLSFLTSGLWAGMNVIGKSQTLNRIAKDADKEFCIVPESTYNGLSAWIPLNTNDGTNCYDIGPDDLDFTSTNANTTAEFLTNAGGCMWFDGTNDYFYRDGRIDSATNGTIMAWVYFRDLRANPPVVSYGGGDVLSAGVFSVRARSATGYTNTLEILQRSDTEAAFNEIRTPAESMVSNTWTHIALTSDGGAYGLYINGIAQSLTVVAGANNGNWFGDTTVGETDLTAIGAQRYDGSFNVYASNTINQLQILDITLSSNDIYTAYLAGSTTGTGKH